MKKLFLSLCAMLMVSLCACSDDDVTIKYSEVPAPVKTFVETYFPGVNVKHVRVDRYETNSEYDLYLEKGIEIEIHADGVWDNIESRRVGIPASLLPKAAQTYISTNYPDRRILEVDQNTYGYEVELDKRVELIFGADGEFRGIDR